METVDFRASRPLEEAPLTAGAVTKIRVLKAVVYGSPRY
jgi:hypothetical protein